MAENMVKNLDIAHLADMLSRDIREMNKSQSAHAAVLIPPDVSRLVAYANSYQKYIDWAVAKSRDSNGRFVTLDLPRTHPQDYPIQPTLENAEDGVDNELVRTIIRHLSAMRHEAIHSQSSQLASGLLPDDKGRLEAIIDRLLKLVEEYIETTDPTDQPETSVTPSQQRSS